MDIERRIELFLSAPSFGVAGASKNRDKFGNKILRCYLQHRMIAVPINPKEKEIEGITCAASIEDLPDDVKSLSIVTPPAVTAQLAPEIINKGVLSVWIQPGAEHPEAIAFLLEKGINVIADGSCLLVVLGYHDD